MMFTSLYIMLLLAVVLFSWIASIYGLMLPSGELIPSMLNNESIRWVVRHSVDNIAQAPIVPILLILILIGVLRSVGVFDFLRVLFRERRMLTLSPRQRYASRIAWIIFIVEVLLLLVGVFGPNGNLLSVTGNLTGGPLANGWLFVMSFVVCVPCLLYGRIADLWCTEHDALVALSSEIVHSSNYFITLVVASQLMASLHYVGVFDYINWTGFHLLLEIIIYGIPLVVSICRD